MAEGLRTKQWDKLHSTGDQHASFPITGATIFLDKRTICSRQFECCRITLLRSYEYNNLSD